jgi:hypothetical protein
MSDEREQPEKRPDPPKKDPIWVRLGKWLFT